MVAEQVQQEFPEIVLDGVTYPPEDIAREVSYRQGSLVVELPRLPLVILKWGRLAARAKAVYEHAARDFTRWKAEQGAVLRKSRADAGEKKPTQAECEAAYRLSDHYLSWVDYTARAEEMWASCVAVKDAAERSCSLMRAHVELTIFEGNALGGATAMPPAPVSVQTAGVVQSDAGVFVDTDEGPPSASPPVGGPVPSVGEPDHTQEFADLASSLPEPTTPSDAAPTAAELLPDVPKESKPRRRRRRRKTSTTQTPEKESTT